MDHVAKPDLRLLIILAGLAGHYGKNYCFPSYKKILELLKKRYGVVMSKRTLARHLGALKDQWYIGRKKRHQLITTGPRKGQLYLRSTITYIFPRATVWLASFLKPFARDLVGGYAMPILALNGKSILRLSFPPSSA